MSALNTPPMLIGQALGPHESKLAKPFAYTTGKTPFKWLGESRLCPWSRGGC